MDFFQLCFWFFFPACYYKTPDVLRLHGSLDIFSFILIFFCNMPHMWYFGLLRCYAMLISYKFGNVFFLFVMTFFSFLPLSSALFSLNCNWWVHINNAGFSISPCAACSVLSKSSLQPCRSIMSACSIPYVSENCCAESCLQCNSLGKSRR